MEHGSIHFHVCYLLIYARAEIPSCNSYFKNAISISKPNSIELELGQITINKKKINVRNEEQGVLYTQQGVLNIYFQQFLITN